MTSSNPAKTKIVKRVNFAPVHKLFAGVAMLGFLVVVIGGIMARVQLMTIVFRALMVMVAVKAVSWAVIKVLSSYEEINSGKT